MAERKTGKRRRGTVLLMIVGLLAMLFIILSAYITLARFDRQTLTKIQQGRLSHDLNATIQNLIRQRIADQWLGQRGDVLGGGRADPAADDSFAYGARGNRGATIAFPSMDQVLRPVPGYNVSATYNYADVPGTTATSWMSSNQPAWLGPVAPAGDEDTVRNPHYLVYPQVSAADGLAQLVPVGQLMTDQVDELKSRVELTLDDFRANARRPVGDADGDGIPDSPMWANGFYTDVANTAAGSAVNFPTDVKRVDRLQWLLQDQYRSRFPNDPGTVYDEAATENHPDPAAYYTALKNQFNRFDDRAGFEVQARTIGHGGLVMLDNSNFNRQFVQQMFSWVRNPEDYDQLGNELGKKQLERVDGTKTASLDLLDSIASESSAVENLLRRRNGLLPTYDALNDGSSAMRALTQTFPETLGGWPKYSRYRSRTTDSPWQRFNLGSFGDADTNTSDEWLAYAKAAALDAQYFNDIWQPSAGPSRNGDRKYSNRASKWASDLPSSKDSDEFARHMRRAYLTTQNFSDDLSRVQSPIFRHQEIASDKPGGSSTYTGRDATKTEYKPHDAYGTGDLRIAPRTVFVRNKLTEERDARESLGLVPGQGKFVLSDIATIFDNDPKSKTFGDIITDGPKSLDGNGLNSVDEDNNPLVDKRNSLMMRIGAAFMDMLSGYDNWRVPTITRRMFPEPGMGEGNAGHFGQEMVELREQAMMLVVNLIGFAAPRHIVPKDPAQFDEDDERIDGFVDQVQFVDKGNYDSWFDESNGQGDITLGNSRRYVGYGPQPFLTQVLAFQPPNPPREGEMQREPANVAELEYTVELYNPQDPLYDVDGDGKADTDIDRHAINLNQFAISIGTVDPATGNVTDTFVREDNPTDRYNWSKLYVIAPNKRWRFKDDQAENGATTGSNPWYRDRLTSAYNEQTGDAMKNRLPGRSFTSILLVKGIDNDTPEGRQIPKRMRKADGSELDIRVLHINELPSFKEKNASGKREGIVNIRLWRRGNERDWRFRDTSQGKNGELDEYVSAFPQLWTCVDEIQIHIDRSDTADSKGLGSHWIQDWRDDDPRTGDDSENDKAKDRYKNWTGSYTTYFRDTRTDTWDPATYDESHSIWGQVLDKTGTTAYVARWRVPMNVPYVELKTNNTYGKNDLYDKFVDGGGGTRDSSGVIPNFEDPKFGLNGPGPMTDAPFVSSARVVPTIPLWTMSAGAMPSPTPIRGVYRPASFPTVGFMHFVPRFSHVEYDFDGEDSAVAERNRFAIVPMSTRLYNEFNRHRYHRTEPSNDFNASFEEPNYSMTKIGSGDTPVPADFGFMPIFDNTQPAMGEDSVDPKYFVGSQTFRSRDSLYQEKYDALKQRDRDLPPFPEYPYTPWKGEFSPERGGKLPWGQLVYDYFTTLNPDDPDGSLTGDPRQQNAENRWQYVGKRDDDAIDVRRIPGRININQAPWFVLAGLPVIGPSVRYESSGSFDPTKVGNASILLLRGTQKDPVLNQPETYPLASPAFWSVSSGVLAGRSSASPDPNFVDPKGYKFGDFRPRLPLFARWDNPKDFEYAPGLPLTTTRKDPVMYFDENATKLVESQKIYDKNYEAVWRLGPHLAQAAASYRDRMPYASWPIGYTYTADAFNDYENMYIGAENRQSYAAYMGTTGFARTYGTIRKGAGGWDLIRLSKPHDQQYEFATSYNPALPVSGTTLYTRTVNPAAYEDAMPTRFGFLSLGELAQVKGFNTDFFTVPVPPNQLRTLDQRLAKKDTVLNGPSVLDTSSAGDGVVGADYYRAVSTMALLDTHFLTTRSNTYTVYTTVFDRNHPQNSVRTQTTIDRSNLVPKLVTTYWPLLSNGSLVGDDPNGSGSPTTTTTDDWPKWYSYTNLLEDGSYDKKKTPVIIQTKLLPEIIGQHEINYFNARYDQ